VPWVETESLSFTARHESSHSEAAARVLEDLEAFRVVLEQSFDRAPAPVSVVIHPRSSALALAAPWLPLAQLVSAPAGRRYFAGWFARDTIHVLAPDALERRASAVPGSREALMLTHRHEYAHLVLGANEPSLPPPFSPSAFRRYVRMAWLCEGAAAHLAGQVAHLRPAVARRLREGGRPRFPPAARDAMVLGGTVFDLLEREAGAGACLELALTSERASSRLALERAFGRRLPRIERAWRDHLDTLTAS
jgi:hypothetical protein